MNVSAEIRWFWRDVPPAGLREWFRDAAIHGMAAGGGATRVDWYVADPAQPELGIKRRGFPGASAVSNAASVGSRGGPAGPVGGSVMTGIGSVERGASVVEVKGLVAREFGSLAADPFSGPLELWSKWRTEALTLADAPLIRTSKRRWLRTFDTRGGAAAEIELDGSEHPVHGARLAAGCGVELTEVTIAGGTWWTLGFEAFGPLDSLAASAQAVATVLAGRLAPAPGGGSSPMLSGGARASYPEWLAREA